MCGIRVRRQRRARVREACGVRRAAAAAGGNGRRQVAMDSGGRWRPCLPPCLLASCGQRFMQKSPAWRGAASECRITGRGQLSLTPPAPVSPSQSQPAQASPSQPQPARCGPEFLRGVWPAGRGAPGRCSRRTEGGSSGSRGTAGVVRMEAQACRRLLLCLWQARGLYPIEITHRPGQLPAAQEGGLRHPLTAVSLSPPIHSFRFAGLCSSEPVHIRAIGR